MWPYRVPVGFWKDQECGQESAHLCPTGNKNFGEQDSPWESGVRRRGTAEGMVQGSWAVAPRTGRESCQRGVEAFREERR